MVWSPATDGYRDPQPSEGAYQYGKPKWVAGASRAGATVQAESYSSGSGISTHAAGTDYPASQNGTVLGSVDGGDWVGYHGVDFGSGADLFTAFAGVDDAYADTGIEIHLDAVNGPLIGVLNVAATGGFDTLAVQSTSIVPTGGKHDVYLVAPGNQPGFGNIDYFSFTRVTCQVPPSRSTGGAP